MFNYFFHPYLRWLHDRSQGDTPDFNFGQAGAPPQAAAPLTVNFPTSESELLLSSASRIGLASFAAEQANEVPGFGIGLQDYVPGFNQNESDLSRPESTWPDGTATPAPEYPNIAPTLPLPPGVKEPDPPASPLPEWLHNLLAVPVPRLSTAFDPKTGRRIVPYEPLIGPVRSYVTTDQNKRGTEDARYLGGISPPPAPEPSHIQRWPFSDMPAPPTSINAGPGTAAAQQANPQQTLKAAAGSAWPQSQTSGWPYAQVSAVERQVPTVMTPQPTGVSLSPPIRRVADSNFILANAGNTGVQSAQEQKAPPQDQPRQEIVAPPDAGLADWQLRVPGKPVLEVPDLERATEQELSRFIDEYRRATATLMDELASAITRFGDRFYHDSILKPRDDLARLAQRFEDDPVNTILSVLNSFPQTRVEGGFLAAVLTILANAARGLAFERAVIDALNAARHTTKIKKNTSKIGVEGVGRSIPDVLHKGITEIKSGVEINNSVQLRVQAAYAKITGMPFNLIVSPSTQRISQQVKEAVRKTGGTIKRFDPATGTCTPIQ